MMPGFPPAFAKPLSLRWALLLGLVVGLAFLPFRMTAGYALGTVLIDDEPELHTAPTGCKS